MEISKYPYFTFFLSEFWSLYISGYFLNDNDNVTHANPIFYKKD